MNTKLVTSIFLAVLTFGSISSARGQWVLAQQQTGGSIVGFASNGTFLFCGADQQGVSRSSDSGATWISVNAGLSNLDVYCIAASGSNVYVGTDTSHVFASNDNGNSWHQASTDITNPYTVFAITTFGTSVFSGSQGHAGTQGGCVFRSNDNGSTWTDASSGIMSSSVFVFASIGTSLFAGGSGVYVSTDSGASWNIDTAGMPNAGVHTLAVRDSGLIAGTYTGEVFLSSTGGTNWKEAKAIVPNNNITALAATGTNLFAGTYGTGIFLSRDSGATWKLIESPQGYIFSFMVIGPYLLAGTSNGVYRRPLSDFDPLSVATAVPANNSLTSFPNPATGSTTIRFSSPDPARRRLRSSISSARKWHVCIPARSKPERIRFRGMQPEWRAGTYLCVVRSNGLTEQIPLMVIR